jgi:hypothetical protein
MEMDHGSVRLISWCGLRTPERACAADTFLTRLSLGLYYGGVCRLTCGST